MQNDRDNIIKVLKTNLPAIIVIAIMTIALKIALNYIMILSFIILSICYIVLGIVVELVMERFALVSEDKGRQKENVDTDIYQHSKKPRIVDMTNQKTEVKETPKRINTSPYASQAAERLRKTKINFDDYMSQKDESSKKEIPYFSSQKTENNTVPDKPAGVTIINDYTSLLNKVRQSDEKLSTKKEEEKEVIKEEKKEVKPEPQKPESSDENDKGSIKDLLFGSKKELYEDFSVKTASDLENESDRIKNEVDKRLNDTNKVSLPYRKKKQAPPDDIIIDTKGDLKHEDDVEKDLPEDFVLKTETSEVQEDIDEISFDVISNKDENNDKAVADSDLISELYKETENKKKQPFWKNLFK